MAEVSAYHARPSRPAAIVLNNGIPWYFSWAAINSSSERAESIARYWSIIVVLSMFASRNVITVEDDQPTPGKSRIGPYSLAHSVRFSVVVDPSDWRTSTEYSCDVIGTDVPSTR